MTLANEEKASDQAEKRALAKTDAVRGAPETGTALTGREKQAINIAGDTVTLGTADYPEPHKTLIRWLHAFAKDSNWTWADLERNLKMSTTTAYRVFTGKYRNPDSGELIDLTNLCDKIARYKELAEERALTNKIPFTETSVFRRINLFCHTALVSQTIVMIYGESQIGKTAALREVQRRQNHGQTIYVLMPASAGVQAMLHTIGGPCHISVRTSFEQLRERVTKFLDPSKLLIIDEVHEVFVSYQKSSTLKCLSVLRQIQEVSQCGMVLCGTNVFRTELEQGEFSQSLKQLRKRGIVELQLESVPTEEDLNLIAKHYKLGPPSPEAAEHVRWIAKEMGLGKYTKFLASSAQMAGKKKERFCWGHFVRTVTIAAQMKQVPEESQKSKR